MVMFQISAIFQLRQIRPSPRLCRLKAGLADMCFGTAVSYFLKEVLQNEHECPLFVSKSSLNGISWPCLVPLMLMRVMRSQTAKIVVGAFLVEVDNRRLLSL